MSWYRHRIQNQINANPNDIPQIGAGIQYRLRLVAALLVDLVTANPVSVSSSTSVITELDSITVNLSVDLVTANPVTVSATATSP